MIESILLTIIKNIAPEIACKLNLIENKLTSLEETTQQLKESPLKAALDTLYQASKIENKELQKQQIHNVIPLLNLAIHSNDPANIFKSKLILAACYEYLGEEKNSLFILNNITTTALSLKPRKKLKKLKHIAIKTATGESSESSRKRKSDLINMAKTKLIAISIVYKIDANILKHILTKATQSKNTSTATIYINRIVAQDTSEQSTHFKHIDNQTRSYISAQMVQASKILIKKNVFVRPNTTGELEFTPYARLT